MKGEDIVFRFLLASFILKIRLLLSTSDFVVSSSVLVGISVLDLTSTQVMYHYKGQFLILDTSSSLLRVISVLNFVPLSIKRKDKMI